MRGARAVNVAVRLDLARRELDRRMRVETRAQLGRRPETLVGLQDRMLLVAAELLVAFLDELPRGVEAVVRAVGHDDQRVLVEIVEERRRLVEEERQVILDAGGQLRLRDRAIDGAAAGLDGKALTEAFAEAFDAGLVEREFARGQDADRVGLTGRELRLGIEDAQAVDAVVVEIHAYRLVAADRKDVEQRAAHGQLARLADLIDAEIAVVGEPAHRGVAVELLADGELERTCDDEAARRKAREQRAGFDDERLRLAACEAVERAQAVRE